MNRKSPMPFRPSELVEQLIADEVQVSGKARNQVINECIASALADGGRLLRIAARGAVSPEVLGEIARRSAYGAEQSASLGRETREAKPQLSRRVARVVRAVRAKRQRAN